MSQRISIPLFVLCALLLILPAAAQPQSNFTRDHAKMVLAVVKDDVKKNYYDPNYHGIDLDARFKTAEEKLKTADSVGMMMGIIAQVLLDFNDSHLFFQPPGRSSRTEYGFRLQAFGDQVFISDVKPGSDAEAKGVKPGDQVVGVNGFVPTRENLWKLIYMFNGLRPQPSLRLALQSPGGQPRQFDVLAQVRQGAQVKDLTNTVDFNNYLREVEDGDRLDRSRMIEQGEDLLIWRMPTFGVDPDSVEGMINRARKFKNVILDLRGNGGGYVVTCERLAGGFFEQEFVMAEFKGRKNDEKPQKTKRTGAPYLGKLIVLIDSRSASASEIFARTIQLQKRGLVLGDRSAGAVMRSRQFGHQLGIDTIIPYGVSVTNADVIMPDGKSLEKVGVIPDEVVLPTGADLAAKRDPVLARAAALLGVKLDAEKAGTLFPVEWKK